jgi:multidrug/hemolysin transport system permease protein
MVWELTKRNVWVYVRDRRSVFFSFLSVIIVIGLYVLFLGKVQSDSIKNILDGYRVPYSEADIPPLVNSWIMAGLLSINTVTLSLGVLGTMVFDIEGKKIMDFVVAPVSRAGVVLSYLFAAWIVDLAFSLIAFVIAEIYILTGGGSLLPLAGMLEAVGLVLLSIMAFSSVMFYIASYLNSESAFASLSTLAGTLIGFVAGIYVPVGVMPAFMQKVIVAMPFGHSAVLLRQVFCDQPLARALPLEAARTAYADMYGINMKWGDTTIPAAAMLAVLIGTAALFLILSAIRLRRYKQK